MNEKKLKEDRKEKKEVLKIEMSDLKGEGFENDINTRAFARIAFGDIEEIPPN